MDGTKRYPRFRSSPWLRMGPYVIGSGRVGVGPDGWLAWHPVNPAGPHLLDNAVASSASGVPNVLEYRRCPSVDNAPQPDELPQSGDPRGQ